MSVFRLLHETTASEISWQKLPKNVFPEDIDIFGISRYSFRGVELFEKKIAFDLEVSK